VTRSAPLLLRSAAALVALAAAACAGPSGAAPAQRLADPQAARTAVARVLDDWHAAAAQANEEAYFRHFAPGGVFLGTDGTERWDVTAFREYAHPHFAKGKAWSFRPVRRAIAVSDDGRTAWFDEDLTTPNLGPARGSGVLVLRDGPGRARWRIAQYNLSVPIPNGRFDQVKKLISEPPIGVPR
jgi:uncharacterized protein (TIGR02246 family)